MATITSLNEFIAYTKHQLGGGVITVEMSDVQITEIIEDSVSICNRYMYGEFATKDYLLIDLVEGTSDYSLSGTDVQDVFDLMLSASADGINDLFSATNMTISPSDVISLSNAGGYSMVDYNIMMQGLQMLQEQFGTSYRVDYLPAKEILRIVPTPNHSQIAMLQVYKKETVINMYNHILLKNLVIAKCKLLWSLILGKYAMTLPGGGTINSGDIASQGQAELEKVMEEIKREGEPVDFFIG